MNWISVDTNKPLKSCDCLVYTKDKAILIAWYQVPVGKYGDRFMYDDGQLMFDISDDVIYWMNLPNPPRED